MCFICHLGNQSIKFQLVHRWSTNHAKFFTFQLIKGLYGLCVLLFFHWFSDVKLTYNFFTQLPKKKKKRVTTTSFLKQVSHAHCCQLCVATVCNSGIYTLSRWCVKKKKKSTGVKGEDKRAALSTKRLLLYLYAEWSSLHLNVSSTLNLSKQFLGFTLFCVVLPVIQNWIWTFLLYRQPLQELMGCIVWCFWFCFTFVLHCLLTFVLCYGSFCQMFRLPPVCVPLLNRILYLTGTINTKWKFAERTWSARFYHTVLT